MSIRLSVLRRRHVWRLPVLAVLAVVFLGAVAFVLACHATTDDRPTASPSTVPSISDPAAAAEHQVIGCPGCLAEPVDVSQDAATGNLLSAPAGTATAADTPECTTHQPCQHEPQDAPRHRDAALRGLDGPRDGGPSSQPACLDEHERIPTSTMPATSSSTRVSVAVLAPVAVLCVDRN